MSPELLDPERFGAKDSRPTKESDCYALGMVIYEVLSGQVPFTPYRNFTVMRKVTEGERPVRPEGVEGLWFTDDLWGILKQCWVPRPESRPSIEAVLECLGPVSRDWKPYVSQSDKDVETSEDDQSLTPMSDFSGMTPYFESLHFTFCGGLFADYTSDPPPVLTPSVTPIPLLAMLNPILSAIDAIGVVTYEPSIQQMFKFDQISHGYPVGSAFACRNLLEQFISLDTSQPAAFTVPYFPLPTIPPWVPLSLLGGVELQVQISDVAQNPPSPPTGSIVSMRMRSAVLDKPNEAGNPMDTRDPPVREKATMIQCPPPMSFREFRPLLLTDHEDPLLYVLSDISLEDMNLSL